MKKTIAQVVQFAAAEMTAANFRGARPVSTGSTDLVVLTVSRTFTLQGSVILSFKFGDRTSAGMTMLPSVDVNMPALNVPAAQAGAYLALLQELTMFALTLQAQVDEFIVTVE